MITATASAGTTTAVAATGAHRAAQTDTTTSTAATPPVRSTDPTETVAPGATTPSSSTPKVESTDTAVEGPVVLLGTGGLRWTDVGDDHPALQDLLATGSNGWLAVRSTRSTTCGVDGWLAISAGARAGDAPASPGDAVCRDPQLTVTTPGSVGSVEEWTRYADQAERDAFDARPGLLGDTLAAAGRSSAAVGPGATVALSTTEGTAPHVYPGSHSDASGIGDPTVLAADVTSALAEDPDLLAVDLGDIVDPDEPYENRPDPTGGYDRPRAEQVTDVEKSLEAVMTALPANATVIVASLADSGDRSMLRLLAASGPAPGGGSYGDSLLGSSSTRQDGLAQTTDLFPTLLSALGVKTPDAAVGSVVKPVRAGMSDTDRDRKLLDLDQAAIAVNPIVPKFFIGLVVGQMLLYAAATLILRKQPDDRTRRIQLLTWLRRVAVVFACVPAATFLANLVPWWRNDHPGLTVTGVVLLFVIPMALIANLGPWKHALLGPIGAVGGMTMAVLGTDVLTGSHLMLSSMMGLQPVVAGRFYGFGNPAFSVFSTGALLLAVALADTLVRRGRKGLAVLAIAVIGAAATIIDGMPGWGSDFGGPPAIIPAFAVLALLAYGVKISWRRALAIAAGTITVIVLLSVLDWLRGPEDRTHLGRFVQTVVDGGAWPVLRRKAEQNLRILFTSYLSWMLPFAVAFVVLVLARPVAWGVRPLQMAYDRSPVLRSGLIAFAVLVIIGFAMNDSGASIVAVSATVSLPLLIAASVRAMELAETDPPAAEVAAATARS
ncbi:hypothetical protein JCM9957A_32240 [Kineosporia succinea]